MVRGDVKSQIRLDKIFDLMKSIDASLFANPVTDSFINGLDDESSAIKSKQTSYRYRSCHKTVTVNIYQWEEAFSARIKRVKTIFSQLLIYGVTANVQYICSECNANKGAYIQAELKDSTNSRYIISSNSYSDYFWENEVETILALHRFYEIYGRLCADNCRAKRTCYKSRQAKQRDNDDIKITRKISGPTESHTSDSDIEEILRVIIAGDAK